jgi:hypothetical protein
MQQLVLFVSTEGTSYIQVAIVTLIIFVLYKQHPYQEANVMTAIQNH